MSLRKRRRKRRQRQLKKPYKELAKPIKRRVKRYLSVKRIVPEPLKFISTPKKSLKRLNKKNLVYKAQRSIGIPGLLQRYFNRLEKDVLKSDCEKRTEKADRVRRRNFFKAKGKGNTSRRPEHNQKHKRC